MNIIQLEDEMDESEEISDDGKTKSTKEIRLDIIVDKGQESIRIDKFIQQKIEGITRSRVQQLIDDDKVLVNEKTIKNNYKIRPLDHIIVFETRKNEIPTEIIPENIAIDIVYEDEAVMIINKKAGMVVHPGNGNYSGTLINAVAYHLQKQNPALEHIPERIGLVHRIDKDTTGLIIIAKTEDALVHLQRQFKNHTVHRRYVALAWGDFEENKGTISGNIARHEKFRKKMDVFEDGNKGKEAITHWEVLERFYYTTLLEFRLETGRTHQIRVHAQHFGHPLFNDNVYGGDRIVKGTVYAKYKQFIDNCFAIINRQALHAKELGFIHPFTNQYMHFDSELPEDMKAVIEKWRVYTKNIKAH